ncbi:hypothetical protein C9374_002219 [Naegleria lovaniensis]|uniref:Translation initiation factor eIF2B subunit epsilon n=1 Tax=Naegleria lovaniensis TaxID=51637 RepID=A0AA88GT97_NAELO|nr:uncharacterized protein C9374_002219 [Naegleria lovaniensis]KAG2386475.1 hypothetical protein C9374_002219 [Naegleria lovaniensis]
MKKGSKKGVAPKTEEILKAVVLADSFTKELRPITLQAPRCLLPVNNVPIIEYVLELLAASGVKEIYVFCCHGAEMIKQYLANSKKWNTPNSDVKISTVEGTEAASAGDALRRIHELDVIRNDFILIQGDVISNLNLAPIVEAHKKERKADPQVLTTSIFRKITPDAINFYEDGDTAWIAISEKNKQLLHYENDKKESLSFEIEIRNFKETKDDIKVISDVMDCRIDICSPEVLGIFQDNFDFKDLRTDFLKSYVLSESEVVAYKVIPYIDHTNYSARVCNLRSYELVSMDLINRWMYPVTPDSNFSGSTSFRYSRPNNYYESNVSLSRSCVIGDNCLIGSGTTIGENTKIRSTVIGRNVKIGNNVTIEGSFIWDDVIIEDGVKITTSLLCNNSKVCNNAVLEVGSVLSFNVVVGPDFTVKAHNRLTTKMALKDEYKDQDEEEISFENAFAAARQRSTEFVAITVDSDKNYVGEGGVGTIYELPPSLGELLTNRMGVTQSEVDLLQKSQTLLEDTYKRPVSSHEIKDEAVFIDEARASIKRAIAENHSIENAKLELNSLKFAYDSSFEDCASATLTGIILYCDKESSTPTEMIGLFQKVLDGGDGKTSWKELLIEFLDIGTKPQVQLLTELLYFVASDEGLKYKDLLRYFVQILYNKDVVSDDSIIEWYEEFEDDDELSSILSSCKELVKSIEEGDEEEDEDEDEEEEEEEDDDEEDDDEE